MSAAHTPTPWLVDPSAGVGCVYCDDVTGSIVARTTGPGFELAPRPLGEVEANARRIVACVNACEGIDTLALEIITSTGNTLRKRFETGGGISLAQLQRDQLLAFARDILGHLPDGGDLDGGDIQGMAVKHGLLIGSVVHEPCNSENSDLPCACAEYCMADEFAEGVICYRRADWVKGGAA